MSKSASALESLPPAAAAALRKLGADSYVHWRNEPMPSFENLQEMAQVVRKVLANETVSELQKRLVQPGASWGGACPKSLITMELARWCGIEVATTRALPIDSGHAVAVRRFDRFGPGRLHAVSAHVALRAAEETPGYPQLAQLLRRVAPAEEIRSQQAQLFRRMVFNIFMDNTDDHEKNHALLRQADGHYRLSPAFDVVPSAQGLGYQAMAIGDLATESTLVNALSQARQFGLKPDAAHAVLREVASGVAGWKEAFAAKGVSGHNIELLAQYIDGDRLRNQRNEFSRV